MPKARNGEGSIKARKVAKGMVYDVQLTVRDRKTGLSRRIFKGGFATERKAVEWRNETMRRSAAGGLVRDKPVTVPEVVDAWMRAMPVKAPTTMIAYDHVIAKHIRPRLNIRVTALTERALHDFMEETKSLVRGGDGNATNARVLQVLKAAMRWASRPNVGLIQVNPLADVGRVSVRATKRREAMPMALVRKLLQVSEGKPSHLLWRMLVETGARRGEITGLTWRDIDFTACQFRVDKIAAPEAGGARTSARTKGRVDRTIPLPEVLAQTLKERLTTSGAALSAPVIPSPLSGKHLRFDTMDRWWHRDCAAAGITTGPGGYTPHCLRHTWATTALSGGVPVNVVSSILGHSSAAITLQVYAHVLPDQRVAAIDIVSDVLHNSSAK